MKVTKEKDSKWWHLESGIPVTKTGTQTGTSTLVQQTEIDTLSFAPSHMHTFVYAIIGTDGFSYQQSFHVTVLLYLLHVAVCSVWYLFPHLVVSIRKHISHSKWHQEQFKTKPGSVSGILMQTALQTADKDEALGRIEGHFICVCNTDVLRINIYYDYKTLLHMASYSAGVIHLFQFQLHKISCLQRTYRNWVAYGYKEYNCADGRVLFHSTASHYHTLV